MVVPSYLLVGEDPHSLPGPVSWRPAEGSVWVTQSGEREECGTNLSNSNNKQSQDWILETPLSALPPTGIYMKAETW